jgi:hypothetical protein
MCTTETDVWTDEQEDRIRALVRDELEAVEREAWAANSVHGYGPE